MPRHSGRYALVVLTLAALAGEAVAQEGSGIPSPSDHPTTSGSAPIVKPSPDLHGRADSGEGQQHSGDSASPGSTGGGVSTTDPAGSGPTMGGDGAPPATGGAHSPSSTAQ